MQSADVRAWFDEIEARGFGAAEDTGMGSSFYPGDIAHRWVTDAESALQQVFPPTHAVRTQWAARLANPKGYESHVRERRTMDALRAIFSSANGQLRAGRLKTLEDGIRAEDASELLDQAEQLVQAGHLVAGAVIAGGALETMLRHLCQKAGAIPAGSGSISKYQQAMAQSRKAGAEVISVGDEKLVIAWGDMRNAAAHTPVEFAKERTASEVRQMIVGVRTLVGKYT